ncbi:MAG: hypothetical protein J7621_14990 [Niastella sp.]|nr:hypothetical protein [Niastella sp.]
MKDQVLQKIKAISEKAKAVKVEAKTGNSRNSLAETIKTKQQAENLKKQLKALQ